MFRESDYMLLLALESNPLMSFSELAERTKMSWPTVKKRFFELISTNDIQYPTAVYKPETIGLERVSVIATVPNYPSLLKMEQFCREHPYTIYRARYTARKFGIFIQFNIPQGKTRYIYELFDRLKFIEVIDDYFVNVSNTYRADTFPNLHKFNPETREWHFDWTDWFNFLDEVHPFNVLREVEPANLEEIKPIHFNILRDLTANASLKQADFMKKYSISRTAAHRYYNYVMDNLVDRVRLEYNKNKLLLTSTHLMIIPNFDEFEYQKLLQAIREAPPPFRMSTDYSLNGDLQLWVNLSPESATNFQYALFNRYPNAQVFPLDTRDNGSASFLFYPANFDFMNHKWLDSVNYIIDSPIAKTFDV